MSFWSILVSTYSIMPSTSARDSPALSPISCECNVSRQVTGLYRGSNDRQSLVVKLRNFKLGDFTAPVFVHCLLLTTTLRYKGQSTCEKK